MLKVKTLQGSAMHKVLERKLLAYCRELRRNWWPSHGTGSWNRALSEGRGATWDETVAWAQDTEHGIFHGMMVGFIAFLIDPHSVADLLPDFLLHDFLRCSGHHADHDLALEGIFRLDPATYHHQTNPRAKSPLVTGDRVELMRYRDHAEWVDWSILPSNLPWDLIRFFYGRQRPHLERFFQHADDIWVRHVVEIEGPHFRMGESTGREVFDGKYPIRYWCPFGDSYAVEIGRLDGGDGMCNKLYTVFDAPMGMLSRTTLNGVGARITHWLDHQMVEGGRLPLEDWCFVQRPPPGRDDLGCVSIKVLQDLLMCRRQFLDVLRIGIPGVAR